MLAGAGAVRGNPTGGAVVAGAATITTVPGTVTINQATTTAAINWQDFSIASGELTRFQVPTSASATLNRVTGGNISAIYGTLQSNGQLYLINPNGIVVGASGKIDTAGFLASTLNFSDAQFAQMGNLSLSGSSTASIVNQGKIHASTGDVYLIAAQVTNGGKISAPRGTVGLAAGNSVLLQRAGDRHLFVQVNAAATPAGTGTGVTNSGAIRAAAAELTAAGGNAYALAINNSGNIKATGIATINGQVFLTTDGADISNSGTISAKQANGNGGTIVVNAHAVKATTQGTVLNSGTIAAKGTVGGTVELLGDRVGVVDAGKVDVSGAAGGGTALIGGDKHGANAAVPDAAQTYIGPDATIDADALTFGTGGKVIVWGNETAQVYGAISARGGTAGGAGGFVETSGANLQVLTAPDVSAPMGAAGSWLLDSSDVTIDDTDADSGFSTTPAFTLTSGTVTISQATLLTALESGDVTIDASTGSGGAGTITWNQSGGPMEVDNAAGHTLTLDAPVSLTLNGVTVIATGTGGLNMVFNAALTGAGSVNLQDATLDLNGGNFKANGNGYQSLIDQNGEANGVNLFGSSIDAEGGNISITGNAGYANPGSSVSAGQGVGIFEDGSGQVALNTTGTGSITIAGSFSQNIASTTPLIGVYVGVGMGIDAEAGTILITGTLGQGTSTSGTNADVAIATGASVESTTSTGVVLLSGETEVDVAGTLSGSGVAVNSPMINLNGATVTTTGTQAGGLEQGLGLADDFGGGTGQINIVGSMIRGSDMVIGYDSSAGSFGVPNLVASQVTINGSSIQLVQGTNPTSALSLDITGVAATAGSAGVSISNVSQITAANGGDVSIKGTGLQAAGSDSTGVSIATSILTFGASSGTVSGSMTIDGQSDSGSTALTPNSIFMNNAYGVQVTGSTISSYDGLQVEGQANAANNLASVGVDLSSNTSIEDFSTGSAEIDATVQPESYSSGAVGEANLVAGLRTVSTVISASGATASVSIKTDTHATTATDNAVREVQVENIGALLEAHTTISASGSTTLLSTPIHLSGRAGAAVASSANTQLTDSFGLSIGGGAASGPVTITNSGLGATVISGEGGSATGGGSSLFSVGVLIGGSSTTPASITAPGGGSIGIAGLGGEIAPTGSTTGQAVGVWSLFSNVTTTTGDIAILAAAGSASGTAGASDLAGLDLGSSIIQTNTSTGGANQIPDGGGSVPPLILIYATGSTVVDNAGQAQFQLGSPDSYAVREDTNSKLITGDLVMGNYYDIFAAEAPHSVVAPTFAQFNSYITGSASGTISSEGITFNPAGLVDLSSPLNQVTDLTAALDGSGGITFFDSTSLTVGTIGASDNRNYGEIDEAGLGPVSITVAPNSSLALTSVSAFTGAASGLPVIATGAGSEVTLTTSGTGTFTNLGGAAAVSAGSEYVIYANAPAQANLDGIAPATTLYLRQPGTVTSPAGNTLAYATGQSSNPSTGGGVVPPPPVAPQVGTSSSPTNAVSDADNDDSSSSETTQNAVLYDDGNSLTADTGIAGGGAGVSTDLDESTDDDQRHKHHRKLKDEMLAEIQLQDARDGSTVNTGTSEPKLTANTGFSRLVHVSEYALLPAGSIQLQIGDPVIARLFDEQATSAVHDEMSRAAGAKGEP
jgi:filamentous hemagglutinin family protein